MGLRRKIAGFDEYETLPGLHSIATSDGTAKILGMHWVRPSSSPQLVILGRWIDEVQTANSFRFWLARGLRQGKCIATILGPTATGVADRFSFTNFIV